jgi:GDP-L-fucose synthase
LVTRKDFDFTNGVELRKILKEFKPEIVVNAAGRVAGIQGNIDFPVELMTLNVLVSTSIMQICHESNIPVLIQFASACVYPPNEKQPSKPSDIGSGRIEITSASYANAKLFAIELARAYRKQYGHNWITIIPTNLYGIGDWNHGSSGHVVSMLTEKFAAAFTKSDSHIQIWGDGQSLRNFLHVQDLAGAVKLIIEKEVNDVDIINIAGDQEISILQLALLIQKISGFQGKLIFDKTRPNGARRKILDDTFLRNLGWRPSVDLQRGLQDYMEAYMLRHRTAP